MTSSRTIPSFVFAIALVMFLAIPTRTNAADVCCGCRQKENYIASCLLVEDAVLAYADGCSTLPVATDLGSNWECDKEPLTETQCRTIDQGGICSTPPQNASLTRKDAGDAIASGGQTKTEAPPIIPNFNVDIPGFVAPEDGGLLFGAYVSAIYRYAISISAVIATVMFIWGGFVYLVGSSMGSVQTGRSIMIDAIIGLVILFSANMILRTLNPKLTQFSSLNIPVIQTVPYEPMETLTDATTGVKTPIMSGSKGNACFFETYGGTDSEIGKRMVKVSFLGNTWPMHQIVAPDFQSAFKEIEAADSNSPTEKWVAIMKRMAPYEGMCKKGKGYPDRGSQYGGSYDPELDKKMAAAAEKGQPPCLSCDMHSFGAAIDLDPCFNTMCPKDQTCALTDPKWNRIPQDVVDIFAKYHIYWGGYGWNPNGKNWSTAIPRRDAMHFEWHGRCWNY